MMGLRGCKGGAEIDALSRRYRRIKGGFRAGHVKRIKRKFWKRTRKLAKLVLLTPR